MRRFSAARHAALALVISAIAGHLATQVSADSPPVINPAVNQADLPAAAETIRDGLRQIASPGIPGTLAVWGHRAHVLISANADGGVQVPLVAIARFGNGHIAALTHSSYASGESMQGDTASLVRKIIAWCKIDAMATHPQPVATNNKSLADWLNTQGVVAEYWDERQFASKLDRAQLLESGHDAASRGGPIFPASVIIYSGTPSLDSARALAAAARNGIGLIVAQTGWGWQQLSNDAPMRTNPWNIALADAGIAWTSEYADDTADDGFVVAAPSPLTHGKNALAFFKARGLDVSTKRQDKQDAAQLRQASRTLMDMARFAQDASSLEALKQVEAFAAARIPTEKDPIRASEGLVRMAIARVVADSIENAASADPNTIKAHPASKAFPGEVPADAPRIAATSIIDLSTPAWHSTGMYVPPGQVVTLTVTPADEPAKRALDKGRISVRVGCHTDQLWHKPDWQRVPSISMRIPLVEGANQIASPFGGALYIDVDNNTKGSLRVDALGVVAAPLFVRGKTSLQDWRDHIRSAPAPWAELATDKVILSVPSSSIRELDDPEALMVVWDQILDNSADLGQIPHQRRRPERYTADAQISAGYMHSGYPIMVPLEAAADMVSVERLRNGTWGLFHELGHNHQEGAWTFDGTGEVTNNLWSLYLMETISNKKPGEGHEALVERNKRMARYILGGAPFDKWKSDPFLALTMYLQIREAFGWEPFKHAFAAYQTLPRDQRPHTDDQKRDLWLFQISNATGKNLGPFFQAWGVPTSDAARASIAHLPEWLPEDFPTPATP